MNEIDLSKPCSQCRHYDGVHDAGGCSVRIGLYELDGTFQETGWCGCTLTGGAKWDATSALARAIAVGRIEASRVEAGTEAWYSLLPSACGLCGEQVRGEAYGFFSPIDSKWTFAHLRCYGYAAETGGAA